MPKDSGRSCASATCHIETVPAVNLARISRWSPLVLVLLGVGLSLIACETMATYSIVVAEESLTIGQGSSGQVTVALVQTQEGIGTVGEFVVGGLPVGAVATFEHVLHASDSIMSITIAGDTPPGTYELTIEMDSGIVLPDSLTLHITSA